MLRTGYVEYQPHLSVMTMYACICDKKQNVYLCYHDIPSTIIGFLHV